MVVVYGSEWGLVLVVVVLIGARIGFLCRFEGWVSVPSEKTYPFKEPKGGGNG
jgi:hypothetical protein